MTCPNCEDVSGWMIGLAFTMLGICLTCLAIITIGELRHQIAVWRQDRKTEKKKIRGSIAVAREDLRKGSGNAYVDRN